MVRIIGISGKPGSNKMFYAFRIIRELRSRGYNTILKSLSAPLYQELNTIANEIADNNDHQQIITKHNLGQKHGQELINLLHPDKIGENNPEYGYSRRNENFRKSLSMLGTQIRREQDENYFIKKFQETIPPQTDFVVVIDLRFPNEADYIQDNDGITIRVEINVPENTEGGYKYNAGINDITETSLDNYYLFNYHFYSVLFNGSDFGKVLENDLDLRNTQYNK